MFAASPLVLVVPANSPAKSVKDLIAMAKAQPGKLNYASVGIGTAQHLIFEMFKKKDGTDMVHVPYKGTNESLPHMIDGQIHAMFDTLPLMLPQLKGGRIRGLAVTTPQRVPQLPDVPTLIESGYPEVDVVTWYALIAPAGTPKEVVAKLNAEATRGAQSKEFRDRMEPLGFEIVTGSPERMADMLRADATRWAPVIKAANVKID